MKKQTYKQKIELDVFNLMDATLNLADLAEIYSEVKGVEP